MNDQNGMSRRAMLTKVAFAFNAIIGVGLAIPVIGYLLSPMVRARKNGYLSWFMLGPVSNFPAGQTRLATYHNPEGNSWDGQTGDIACWVRHVDGDQFQVFAVNCAHLGCPVRWFPQSGLFMCPCHGGAYYEDGSRASGPPERGLFTYEHRVQNGQLYIDAGSLPTPGGSAANRSATGTRCV
jgi:menaquinol-cytochrome c reductase iron-sulfur subunit